MRDIYEIFIMTMDTQLRLRNVCLEFLSVKARGTRIKRLLELAADQQE